MTDQKVKVDRFCVFCSKPFDAVTTALTAALGQPDIVEYFKWLRSPMRTWSGSLAVRV